MVSTHIGLGFLMKLPDNKTCFDCGSISPTFSSVNNGVLICAKCADLHKTFPDNISYVKSTTDENWKDEEVMFLQVAGNKRFLNLMTEFRIPQVKNIDYKYSVIAADYYRKLIFAELNELASPMKPEIHIGQKLISLYILEQKALAEKANAPVKKGFFGKLDSVFTDVKNKISEGAQQLDNKYDLSGHGQKAVLFCKVASDKMNEKGREITNHPTVQEYSKKTTDGFNDMVNATKKSLNIGQNEQQNNTNQNLNSQQQNNNQSNEFNSQNNINNNQNLNNQQQNNNQSNLTIQTNQSTDNSHNNQQSTIQSNSTVQSNQSIDNKPKQI